MRLAKLEPHVLEPVMDGRDINSFVTEVNRDGIDRVKATSTDIAESDPPIQKEHDEIKKGFIRLVDYLKGSPKRKNSKLSLAVSAYLKQHSVFTQKEYLGTKLKRVA